MVLDTNALVGWWEYWYPPAHHDWWDALAQYAETNRVLIPEEVYVELRRWPDLLRWCDDHRDAFFYPNSVDVDALVAQFANRHARRLRLTRHSDNADLYVLASAFLEGLTVITDERTARERFDNGDRLAKYKIPDIAKDEGISCERSYSVIRSTGWKFRRET